MAVKIAGIIIVCVVAVAAVGLWTLGAFQRVEVNAEEVGPFTVVYLEHKGPYFKIGSKIVEVEKMLKEKNISMIEGFGEYFDNPQAVKSEDLRSNGGAVITGPVTVPDPFKTKTIERIRYASVVFKGSPAFGPFRVYPKITQWMNDKGYTPSGPAIELYRRAGGKMTIQFLMPIKPVHP